MADPDTGNGLVVMANGASGFDLLFEIIAGPADRDLEISKKCYTARDTEPSSALRRALKRPAYGSVGR